MRDITAACCGGDQYLLWGGRFADWLLSECQPQEGDKQLRHA